MAKNSATKEHCLAQNSITQKDIFLLGIITIVGVQYTGWSAAYGNGIEVSSVIFSLLAAGYFLMTLSLAEMTSALPFSGGIYGLARAFLHPLLGFLVAALELMMNILYIAPAVYDFASLGVTAGLMSRDYILVVCLLTYLFVTVICLIGGKMIWRTVLVSAIALLVCVLIYQLGSLPVADFPTWGHSKDSNIEMTSILKYIPRVAPIFLGIQFLPLTSRCAKKPKRDIPLMMVAVMVCSIVIALGFMILAGSQSPGILALADEYHPLRYGYSQILGISKEAGALMSLPYVFGTIIGFTFFCTRQMYMMAKSKLLPTIFAAETPVFGTPYVSIISLCVICFALNALTFGMKDVHFLTKGFYLMSSLASFIVCIAALKAYLVFQQKYSSLERGFRSPFQAPGAMIGIIIFLLCLIGG